MSRVSRFVQLATIFPARCVMVACCPGHRVPRGAGSDGKLASPRDPYLMTGTQRADGTSHNIASCHFLNHLTFRHLHRELRFPHDLGPIRFSTSCSIYKYTGFHQAAT
jgi:hypothetical protein